MVLNCACCYAAYFDNDTKWVCNCGCDVAAIAGCSLELRMTECRL